MKLYSIDTGNPNEQFVISEINVSYMDFNNGNPYNTTFSVNVTSGDFSGISKFENNIKDFVGFVKEINELYNFNLMTVELNDICYGSSISFNLDKTGHIKISGTLYGSAMEHSMTFVFSTDQTAIATFCNQLYKDFVIDNLHKF